MEMLQILFAKLRKLKITKLKIKYFTTKQNYLMLKLKRNIKSNIKIYLDYFDLFFLKPIYGHR